LAVAVPLACGFGTLWWFSRRDDANPMSLHTVGDVQNFVTQLLPLIGLELFVGVLVLALSSIPIIMLVPTRSAWSAVPFLAIVLAACAVGLALKTGQWPAQDSGAQAIAQALKTGLYFPYMGSTLPDGFFVIGHDPEPMLVRRPVQYALTAIACVAGAWFIVSLVQGVRAWRTSGRPLGLLALFTVIQVLILPLAPRPYDRYYLAILPGVLLLLARAAEPRRCRPVWAL